MPEARDDGAVAPPPIRRRTLAISAAVLAVVVVLGVVAVAGTEYGSRDDRDVELEEQGGAKPHIIPRPDEGQAPEDPGDRGGWAQLLVLGLVVAGLGLIVVLIWRSGRAGRRPPPPAGQGGVDATKSATTVASSGPRSS